jgi:hypothetical protein
MSKELASMSRNPPSINSKENFANYSTSTGCSTRSSLFVALLSTYFSSSKSLVMTNAGTGDVVYL